MRVNGFHLKRYFPGGKENEVPNPESQATDQQSDFTDEVSHKIPCLLNSYLPSIPHLSFTAYHLECRQFRR